MVRVRETQLMHWAVLEGRLDLVEILVGAKADPNGQVSRHELTVQEVAMLHRRTAILEYLVKQTEVTVIGSGSADEYWVCFFLFVIIIDFEIG